MTPLHLIDSECLPADNDGVSQEASSYDRVVALAASYRRLIPQGASCGLYFDSSAHFLASLLACWSNHSVPLLLPDTRKATLSALKNSVAIILTDLRSLDDTRIQSLIRSSARGRDTLDLPHRCEEDVALQLFTSGSGGQPRLIPKSFRQLNREIENLEAAFPPQTDHAIVTTVSHQHIYGLLFGVLWPLSAGRCIAKKRIIHWDEVYGDVSQGDLTIISSPALLQYLPKLQKAREYSWTGVRLYSSGNAIPPENASALNSLLGSVPIEIFGSTETGGIAWRRQEDDSLEARLWRCFPNVEVSENGGTMSVCSPTLPDPYAWHTTSDQIRLESDGRFEHIGRGDSIIKVSEIRISTTRIELALKQSPLLRDCRVFQFTAISHRPCVVAVPDKSGEEYLYTGKRMELIKNLLVLLEEVVPRAALPRIWRFLNELPYNSQGKMPRNVLSEIFRRESDGRENPVILENIPGLRRLDQKLIITDDLACLQSQSTGVPVVPETALLSWISGCTESLVGKPVRSNEFTGVTSHELLRPGQVVNLALELMDDDREIRFALSQGELIYCSGVLSFST